MALYKNNSTDSATLLVEMFFHQSYQALLCQALAITKRQALSEDAVQKCFYKLLQMAQNNPAKIEKLFTENIDGYAYRMVRNECLRLMDKFNREANFEQVSLNEYGFSLKNIGETDDIHVLLSCLKSREKEAVLIQMQGYAYIEIAEKMDTSIDAIKGLLKRARAKLKTHLESVRF